MAEVIELNTDLKHSDILAAFREVFQNDAGQIVFSYLIDRFGTESPTFDPDPYIHAHNSGLQEAGLTIKDLINESLNVQLEGDAESNLQQEAEVNDRGPGE